MEDSVFSLDGRVMCNDESCIGTVGPDGKCKVCGIEYQGDEPLDAPVRSESPTDETPPGERSDDNSEKTSPSDSSHDPDERVCCPDEACIGIIGANGKCGTCGTSS